MHVCSYAYEFDVCTYWENSYCYVQAMWMTLWVSSWQDKSQFEANEQHLSLQTTPKKRIDLVQFQGSNEKEDYINRGSTRGLTEGDIQHQSLKNNEKDWEMGQRWQARETKEWSQIRREQGQLVAQTALTTPMDTNFNILHTHSSSPPWTYYWHLTSKLSLLLSKFIGICPHKVSKKHNTLLDTTLYKQLEMWHIHCTMTLVPQWDSER